MQNWAVQKATTYVESTIGTDVDVEKIYFSWPNGITIKNLYVEDQNADTLVYAEHFYAGLDYFALLHAEVEIGSIELENAVANIVVSEVDTSFNFDYIITAFAPADTSIKSSTAADTTAMDIDISSIEITNTRFNYIDHASGLEMSYHIGELYVETQEFDITKNIYYAEEITLKNSSGEIIINKISPVDTSTSPLPSMKVGSENLVVENTHISFNSKPDKMLFTSTIGNLDVSAEPILLDKQNINLNEITLGNSKLLYRQGKIDSTAVSDPQTTNETQETEPWKISLDAMEINKLSMAYQDGNIEETENGLDFGNLSIALMHSELSDFYFNGADSIGIDVDQLRLLEKSGFEVQEMQAHIKLNPNSLSAKNVYLKTGNSLIKRKFELGFSSLENIAENIEDLAIDVEINQSYVGFSDLLHFIPSLSSDTSMEFLKNKKIHIDGSITGTVKNLAIKNFQASIPDSTSLSIEGNIKNLPNMNALVVNFPVFNLSTTANAMESLMPDSTIPKSIQLPHSINLNASAKGSMRDMEAFIDLKTSFGNLMGDFHLQSPDTNLKTASYTADFEIPSFELDRLLQDTAFGSFSFKGTIEGRGMTTENIVAELDAKLSEFEYNSYQYSDLSIDGLLEGKKFTGHLEMNDSNLIFTFDGMASLDTNNMEYNFKLNLKAADLQHLGLHEEDVRLKGLISSNIEGSNLNNINGKLELRDFLIIYNGENYPVDSLLFVSISDSGKTDIELNSTILSGHFTGTIHLAEIYPTLKDHLYTYIAGKDVKNTKTSAQNFDFDLVIHDEDILTDILVPDLHRFVTGTLKGSYNSTNRNLDIQLQFPLIEYQNFIIDSLYFISESNKDQLNYTLNLDKVSYDTLSISNMLLQGVFQNDSLINTFTISEESGESFFQLASAVTGFQDMAKMKFLNKTIFDYQQWEVNPDNRILLGEELTIENLTFTKGKEFISIKTTEERSDRNVDVEFGNFQLENLTEIITVEEPSQNRFGLEDWDTTQTDTSEIKEEKPLIEGTVDGKISLPQDSNSALTANMNIMDIKSSGIPVGNVSIEASEISSTRQRISASLSGMDNDMQIRGSITQVDTGNVLDLTATINKLQLKSIEPFVSGQIKKSEGYFSGQAEISGSVEQPEYTGQLQFHNIKLKPTYLGTTYSIPDEEISFSNSEIELDNFTVYDSLNNSFAIDGSIFIEKITNPEFDLQVNSDEFLFLNTTQENDNDLFYGTIIISSKIDVTGNLNEPVVVANVDLEEGSDLTFIVPNDEPVSLDQEGLVEFVDMDNNIPELLTEDKSVDTVKMDVLGVDLEAFVRVDPETEVTIVIDPVTGDHLLVKGGGEFRTTIDPTGAITLNGLYEIQEGSYELRLYNLVRRKFEIQSGSTILWNGDPLAAEMDIDAVYEVKTSPIDLLGSQVTHLSSEQQYTYNQKLDFRVILLLNGELMQPDIGFELQLEEDDRGAMGGIVLSKLNEINNNPSELNKQVFALLVFKRFISQDPFASNENAGANMARQSVSRLLNQQLNNLTGGDIQGIQIELNVDSYQDYNAEGDQVGRTEVGLALSKSLFDQRVVVKVNNDFDVEGERATTPRNSSSNFAGDISVEYLITEDGKYRIKFYRDNNYEGIIEGQLIETGISLIFAKDYEHFHDLFKKKNKEQNQENTEGTNE